MYSHIQTADSMLRAVIDVEHKSILLLRPNRHTVNTSELHHPPDTILSASLLLDVVFPKYSQEYQRPTLQREKVIHFWEITTHVTSYKLQGITHSWKQDWSQAFVVVSILLCQIVVFWVIQPCENTVKSSPILMCYEQFWSWIIRVRDCLWR